MLEEELGPRCAEVIELDPQPLGAASLAQVHRASLRSGRQVVLKVQRQGLDRRFRLDLDVMQQVAAVLSVIPVGEGVVIGLPWPVSVGVCCYVSSTSGLQRNMRLGFINSFFTTNRFVFQE